jgi:hypothetical protein
MKLSVVSGKAGYKGSFAKDWLAREPRGFALPALPLDFSLRS